MTETKCDCIAQLVNLVFLLTSETSIRVRVKPHCPQAPTQYTNTHRTYSINVFEVSVRWK